MEWNELIPLLDRLEDTKRPGEVTSAITKAKKDMHFIGGYAAFIRMVILKDAGVQPKLGVVPFAKRILLDQFLDEAYKYHLLGAFNHRDNPELFEAYCSPFSTKRGKYLDEMTTKQREVIEMMDEDIRAHKRKERKQLPTDQGQSFIEDALNNAIRKRVNEEGSDPA